MVAALTHLLTQQQSTVPTVGASGAIAGVLGAYLLLFSDGAAGGDVSGVLFLPFFFEVPAVLYLGCGSSCSCLADRWRWRVPRMLAVSRGGHTSVGLWQGSCCAYYLRGGPLFGGCNPMSTASSGRGSPVGVDSGGG